MKWLFKLFDVLKCPEVNIHPWILYDPAIQLFLQILKSNKLLPKFLNSIGRSVRVESLKTAVTLSSLFLLPNHAVILSQIAPVHKLCTPGTNIIVWNR